jgi:hypothetical protein
MLGKLPIAGAVVAILLISTTLFAQVWGAAVNPGAAVRGARGVPAAPHPRWRQNRPRQPSRLFSRAARTLSNWVWWPATTGPGVMSPA